MSGPTTVLESLGRSVVGAAEELGRVVGLLLRTLADLPRRPARLHETLVQLQFIGIQSLPIVLLPAVFTGAVFTWESHEGFAMMGAQGLVGGTVGVAITRELAPTLTGLLVAGRAGSAMAAEIASMRVSEQIDALESMAVDPVNFLVKPRLIASTLAVPLLTAVFDFVGILGSYFVGIYLLHMTYPEFMVRLQDWVDWDDIAAGLIKATAFGVIVGIVACTKGFYTRGGAVGVGQATTSAVVHASVAILVSNFFIAVLLP